MHIAHLRGQTQLLTRLMQINTQFFELGETPLDITQPVATARNVEIPQPHKNEERARTHQTQSQVHMARREEGPRLSVNSRLRDLMADRHRAKSRRNPTGRARMNEIIVRRKQRELLGETTKMTEAGPHIPSESPNERKISNTPAPLPAKPPWKRNSRKPGRR